MKQRSINVVRTTKAKKALRQRRSNGLVDIASQMKSDTISSKPVVFAWNSSQKGGYVKKIHGKLGS